ncbi:MAG: hypothetical protein H2036_04235 [Acidimicrobiales bacterium]|nr:hypothetical protein [Acidimicrobiales bacterium]
MAQVENWHQAKNELRDSIENLFGPIKLIDDNDDPSMPAVFAIVGFGLFAASAWLWDQHWILLVVFVHYLYLVITKTKIGKAVFYFVKSIMWFPIIAGMFLFNVCIAIPRFKYQQRALTKG